MCSVNPIRGDLRTVEILDLDLDPMYILIDKQQLRPSDRLDSYGMNNTLINYNVAGNDLAGHWDYTSTADAKVYIYVCDVQISVPPD